MSRVVGKGGLLDVRWNQICGGNLEQQTCFLRGEVFALPQARDFKYLGILVMNILNVEQKLDRKLVFNQ